MRKKFIALILVIALALSNVSATGMPVIDISSIAATIEGIVAEASRWKQQIQEWKSTYDRIKKMGEGIATGEWQKVIAGISEAFDMTGDVVTKFGDLKSEQYANALKDWSGSASDILKIYQSSGQLVKNLGSISQALTSSFQKKIANDDVAGALSGGITDGIDLGTNLLENVLSILNTSTDAANGILGSFYLDSEEYLKLLKGMKQDIVNTLGYTSDSAFVSAMKDGEYKTKMQELAEAQKEYGQTKEAEEGTKKANLKTKIEGLEKELETLLTGYDNYKVICDIIAQVEADAKAKSNISGTKSLDEAVKAHNTAVAYLESKQTTEDKMRKEANAERIIKNSLGYGMSGVSKQTQLGILRVNKSISQVVEAYDESDGIFSLQPEYGHPTLQ